MKRWTSAEGVVIAFACIAAVIFILLDGAGPPPAKSDSIQAWTPLATSAFLPIDPLERPIHSSVPGSAGPGASPASTGCNVSSRSVQWPRQSSSSASPSGCGNGRPSTPPTARPTGGIGTAVGTVKGSASFYAYVPGGAAAAARLRAAIGPNWRGRRVTVWYGGRHVSVVLSDFERSTIPGRLIDLNQGSFAQLVGPGWYQRGRVWVEVTW